MNCYVCFRGALCENHTLASVPSARCNFTRAGNARNLSICWERLRNAAIWNSDEHSPPWLFQADAAISSSATAQISQALATVQPLQI